MELHACDSPGEDSPAACHSAREPGRPPGRPRLDQRTKLVSDAQGPGYKVAVYPTVGEAVITFQPSYRPRSHGRLRHQDEQLFVPGESNLERAERRARTTLRRYCVHNGIDRLATLTYGPPFCLCPKQVREDAARFLRRLRVELGCKRFPYVWVPEVHADGERFHLHVGFNRYVKKELVQRCWPHGFVDIRLIRSRRVRSAQGHARQTAFYLSKYVGKALDAGASGSHRYEVGQGFQPKKVELVAESEYEARGLAIGVMHGELPASEWSSADSEDWTGPACRTMEWRL